MSSSCNLPEVTYKTVLVARHVDADDPLETEVPFEFGLHERSNEATAGGIDVDGTLDTLLDQEIVDCLDVLILASVGSSEDTTYANGVFIDELDRLLWVDDISILRAEDVFLLNLKVSCG